MIKCVSFAIGTKVKLIKNHILNKGRIGYIEEVTITSGELQYSFEGCAWFDHDDFQVLEQPTRTSLSKVIEALNAYD